MSVREDPCPSFLIKICGIVSLQEARLSISHGANALGFNFYRPSPRYIEPEQAREIITVLPSDVLTVAVLVVNEAEMEEISRLPVDTWQVHGLRSESEVPETEKRLWIATSPSDAARFPHHEILIDTSWGRGRQADWEHVGQIGRPFILSGGLSADNVAEAIALLNPMGVDVCSGVERSPGVKDGEKIRRFIKAARSGVTGRLTTDK